MNPDIRLMDAIDAYCQSYDIIPSNTKIILGLSGGPDSTLLLEYLAKHQASGKISIVAAHLNHEWRPNSQNDVEFCRQQTDRLGVRLVAARASELLFKPKFNGSKEELGRRLRRHFFETVRAQEDADFIALAHQMNDQLETFFIRLIRGSSLSGLVGMQPRKGTCIRPLLGTERRDIIAYLDEHNIPYLTDPSNQSDLYLRNRIRNKLVPILKTIDNRFEQNFQRTLQQLKETDDFLHSLTIKTLADISSCEGNTLFINTKKFRSLDHIIQKRVLLAWLIHEQVAFSPSDQFLTEIIDFIARPEGKTHQLHSTWAIKKSRGNATIVKDSGHTTS